MTLLVTEKLLENGRDSLTGSPLKEIGRSAIARDVELRLQTNLLDEPVHHFHLVRTVQTIPAALVENFRMNRVTIGDSQLRPVMFACLVVANSDPCAVLGTGLIEAFHNSTLNHGCPSTRCFVDSYVPLSDQVVLLKLFLQVLTLAESANHNDGSDRYVGGSNLPRDEQLDSFDTGLKERDDIKGRDLKLLIADASLLAVRETGHWNIKSATLRYTSGVDNGFDL